MQNVAKHEIPKHSKASKPLAEEDKNTKSKSFQKRIETSQVVEKVENKEIEQ